MMAAGLLTIAHRSGGPLMDIITEESGSRNGFLAVTAQEYAAHIAFIISMSEEVGIFKAHEVYNFRMLQISGIL